MDIFLWSSKRSAICAFQCTQCRCLYFYEKTKHVTTPEDLNQAMWWLLGFLHQWPADYRTADTDDGEHASCARLGAARLGPNGMGISDDFVDADAEAANDYKMLDADADDTDFEMHEVRRSNL